MVLRSLGGKGFDQGFAQIQKKGSSDENSNGTFEYKIKNLDGTRYSIQASYKDAGASASANVSYEAPIEHVKKAVWGMSDTCVVDSDKGKIILMAQLAYDPDLDGSED